MLSRIGSVEYSSAGGGNSCTTPSTQEYPPAYNSAAYLSSGKLRRSPQCLLPAVGYQRANPTYPQAQHGRRKLQLPTARIGIPQTQGFRDVGGGTGRRRDSESSRYRKYGNGHSKGNGYDMAKTVMSPTYGGAADFSPNSALAGENVSGEHGFQRMPMKIPAAHARPEDTSGGR
ncbi:hypothetical protein WMY93_003720 [Mugilogobius chulae]|uniref:Uncharacterized protein n=1 Tax=Mugilogobius chulae TaxID=88201 RepID=A0AAW0Q8A9_9GOBI